MQNSASSKVFMVTYVAQKRDNKTIEKIGWYDCSQSYELNLTQVLRLIGIAHSFDHSNTICD
jgi:ribosomal protein S16